MHKGRRNGDRNPQGGDRAIAGGYGLGRRGDRWLPDRWINMPVSSPGGGAGGAVLSDSWDLSHPSTFDYVLNGSVTAVGQAFTSIGGTLYSAKFNLGKAGAPAGTIIASLYAATGTFPTAKATGNPLANSAVLDCTGMVAGGALLEFLFTGANQFVMVPGTNYCIVMRQNSGVFDASNRILVGSNFNQDLPPKHPGNLTFLQVATWTADDFYDLTFYLYTA